MKKLLVINGPNLNMLGIREPDIYGQRTYADLVGFVTDKIAALGAEATVVQSNHEGELVDFIQSAYQAYDGIIINPAAYTHTSIAILDAVKAVGVPCVGGTHLRCFQKRGLPPGKLHSQGLRGNRRGARLRRVHRSRKNSSRGITGAVL